MPFKTAMSLALIVVICFSQAGCMFMPFYKRPTRTLGAWKTYEFEGNYACKYEGRSNQGTETTIEYVDGGTLEDGTEWALLSMSDVVPIIASNTPHHVFNRSFGVLAVSYGTESQDEGSIPVDSAWVINERWPRARVDAMDRDALENNLRGRAFQQLSGEVIFEAGRSGRIDLKLDAGMETEEFNIQIDGRIRTRVNRGLIVTTYNAKHIPHDNYHPWISSYWK